MANYDNLEIRVVKANVEIGQQKQLQPRHFVFVLRKKPCPEHATECGACDGSGYLSLADLSLDVEAAHYHIWTDALNRWRWSMTPTKYPYDEVGIGSHGGGASANACIRHCIRHYEHDILALNRDR